MAIPNGAQVLTLIKRSRGGRHKKGRKIGQNKKKPCHIRYTNEKRWLTNKARRIRKCNGEDAWLAFCDLHNL
jgi:hypothetical protein